MRGVAGLPSPVALLLDTPCTARYPSHTLKAARVNAGAPRVLVLRNAAVLRDATKDLTERRCRMLYRTPVLPALTLSLILALLPSPCVAQGYPTTEATRAKSAETARRFRALAPALVQSAAIKVGDLVSISGGPAMVEEMEALGLEVQKAGGRPLLILDSPTLIRNFYADVPEKQIERSPTSWEAFYAQSVDVAFELPLGEDFMSLRSKDLDRTRRVDQVMAGLDKATAAQRDKGKTRTLSVSVPTLSDTASIQMDYGEYERMQWSAIEADYKEMASKGEQIRKILAGAKKLHITSAEGTDFTVNLGPRQIFVRAGVVAPGTKGTAASRYSSLPSGYIVFAPMETTGNGKVRTAEDQCEKPVKDETMDVRNGMPENVTAGSDEACVQRSLKEAGRLGNITIGLNPNVKYDHVPSYGPQLQNAAGVVQIGFAPNQDLGGANRPAPGGWSVPLLKATVEADGKVIVKDGKLAL
jgi:leucyl aminopeptidase (aminopeptidase T)